MRRLATSADISEMLTTDASVGFFSVNWSDYAKRGEEVFTRAESKSKDAPNVLWWIADISDVEDDTTKLLHQWLIRQSSDLHLFPAIGLGNGAVVWVKQGRVIDLAASAELLGVGGLCDKTAQAAI